MKRLHGSVMVLVLIFGGVFFMLLVSLSRFVLAENRAQNIARARAEAFSIAEAGLAYYQWFLAHYPNDIQNGTGETGPYVMTYSDPNAVPVGTYTLSIAGTSACGSIQTVDVTSSGVPNNFPSIDATLIGKYAAPTVATYATIIDNGAIPEVDFDAITPDYDALKATAQISGIFLPKHEIPQDPHVGYHLIFNSDGTVTINLVTAVRTLHSVRPANSPSNYINDYTLIQSEESYQTRIIESGCGLIFSEDNVWLEGVVPAKVTVVAANQSGGGTAPDIILRDNITYTAYDGSVGLTAIAEHYVLIAPDAPHTLTLNGIFAAPEGIFGRHNYYFPSGGCSGLYEARGTLTIQGTIVSKLAPKTNWPNGCGSEGDAGYQMQTVTADLDVAASPPPFTPATSAARRFVDWRQLR